MTPIAKVEFFSIAMMPYAFMVVLGLGCAFAIVAVALERHKASDESQVKREEQT